MENVGLIVPRSLCLFSTLLPNLPYIQVRVRYLHPTYPTAALREASLEETKNDLISFENKLLQLEVIAGARSLCRSNIKKDFYSTRIMAYSCLEIKAQ